MAYGRVPVIDTTKSYRLKMKGTAESTDGTSATERRPNSEGVGGPDRARPDQRVSPWNGSGTAADPISVDGSIAGPPAGTDVKAGPRSRRRAGDVIRDNGTEAAAPSTARRVTERTTTPPRDNQQGDHPSGSLLNSAARDEGTAAQPQPTAMTPDQRSRTVRHGLDSHAWGSVSTSILIRAARWSASRAEEPIGAFRECVTMRP